MLEQGDFFGRYQEMLSGSELSSVRYGLPVRTDDLKGIYKPMYSPEHRGEFATAVDFAIADPRVRRTEILCPADGIVVSGVLNNTRWGESEQDKKYLNWVHIRTNETEFFELAHIYYNPERILHVGDKVKKGEVIAFAGLNGRVTTTNGEPDSHIHMYVGKYLKQGKFKGLRINWES